jgi:hypothetical protein
VKIALAALAMLGLTGCGASDPGSSFPNSVGANANCSAVARDRASDAGAEGEDSQTQNYVFEHTYSDCTAWHLAHGN